MRIKFTKHALEKFLSLEKEDWKFSPRDIKNAIQNPYFSEINEERGVIIVLKRWDRKHDLRVIYKEEGVIITVITFYPAEKRRYAK